jgi:hypothetical protein
MDLSIVKLKKDPDKAAHTGGARGFGGALQHK